MIDIIIKWIILMIFFFMEEIPYLIKLVAICLIGTILIIDWYSVREEDDY